MGSSVQRNPAALTLVTPGQHERPAAYLLPLGPNNHLNTQPSH